MATLKVLDLFSGIGGFALGLDRAGGFKTAAFCEIRGFQRAILHKHWPHVPQIDDIRMIHFFGCDVICGGFPCQPFSTASRGRRVAENLWPEMLRVVLINKPAIVIAENVQKEPVENAATDLRRNGYSVTVRNISADDCGAPHGRSRWWAIAHPYNESEFQCALDAEVGQAAGTMCWPLDRRSLRERNSNSLWVTHRDGRSCKNSSWQLHPASNSGGDWQGFDLVQPPQPLQCGGTLMADLAARISIEGHGAYEPRFECEVPGGAE